MGIRKVCTSQYI